MDDWFNQLTQLNVQADCVIEMYVSGYVCVHNCVPFCVCVSMCVCLTAAWFRPLLFSGSGSWLLLSLKLESLPADRSAVWGFVSSKLSSGCVNMGMVSCKKSQVFLGYTDLRGGWRNYDWLQATVDNIVVLQFQNNLFLNTLLRIGTNCIFELVLTGICLLVNVDLSNTKLQLLSMQASTDVEPSCLLLSSQHLQRHDCRWSLLFLS